MTGAGDDSNSFFLLLVAGPLDHGPQLLGFRPHHIIWMDRGLYGLRPFGISFAGLFFDGLRSFYQVGESLMGSDPRRALIVQILLSSGRAFDGHLMVDSGPFFRTSFDGPRFS